MRHMCITVCFCNGAVTSWFKVLSSFKFSPRGQNAASETATPYALRLAAMADLTYDDLRFK